jgi:hypothetical protein
VGAERLSCAPENEVKNESCLRIFILGFHAIDTLKICQITLKMHHRLWYAGRYERVNGVF